MDGLLLVVLAGHFCSEGQTSDEGHDGGSQWGWSSQRLLILVLPDGGWGVTWRGNEHTEAKREGEKNNPSHDEGFQPLPLIRWLKTLPTQRLPGNSGLSPVGFKQPQPSRFGCHGNFRMKLQNRSYLPQWCVSVLVCMSVCGFVCVDRSNS